MAGVVASGPRRISVVTSGVSEASLRGIARFARERDWHVSTDLTRIGAVPQGWHCDGLLVSFPQPPELLAQLENVGTPCVAFSEAWERTGLPLVMPDEAEIGRLAADHLVERAHRHFACAPFVDRTAQGDRFTAFQARLAEHGCDCRFFPPMYTRQGSAWCENSAERRRALVGELRRLPRPAAVFAFNDGVAVDVVDACRDAGLSVPEDVAILGVNDSIFCATSFVPLSSVDLNLEEIGYRAAALLEERMSGLPPAAAVLPVRPKGVVTRMSTDVIAVTDPRVARALSYIAEHYPETGLSVEVVARAVGMSRRSLERTFRQETGRTIHEHIINVRMREASRLIAAAPGTKTSDVAALVGLAGERTFFRTFRRHFGMSPKAHRRWTTQARFVEDEPDMPPRPRVSAAQAPHALASGADFSAA